MHTVKSIFPEFYALKLCEIKLSNFCKNILSEYYYWLPNNYQFLFSHRGCPDTNNYFLLQINHIGANCVCSCSNAVQWILALWLQIAPSTSGVTRKPDSNDPTLLSARRAVRIMWHDSSFPPTVTTLI